MNAIKKLGLLIIGWLFIVLGILGLFIPILQGILFIMIGLAILSSRSEMTKRFLKHLEKRYPRQHERIETWEKRLEVGLKRVERRRVKGVSLLFRSFQKVSS